MNVENITENLPVLEINHLSKSFSAEKKVLDDVSLTVPAGKIIGLLGPNGCGKTTLIKLVMGLLVPDSGEIKVCGASRSALSNALISYLPERTYFNSYMTVNELIAYFTDFFADFDAALARKMLCDLRVPERAKLKTLSKGTKEKIQLVLVMARRAKLYLLDEPIAGVDPAARDYILQTIIGNYNPQASVIITTHLIADVEPVLDQFFFIGPGGEIKASGLCDDVRQTYNKSLDTLFREVFKCSENC